MPSNNNGNCESGYYSYGGCYSGWYSWGRWIVLGLIVLGALAIFFLFSCLSARRRRKMGAQPYRGTGWALGRTPAGHAPATYNQQPYYANQQNQYQPPNNPPPAYGASQGYYGGRNDVELQSPPAAYGGQNSGGQNVYSPPPGPPPQKNDGIIR
ncbi:hypothetical protein LTR37_003883 [Vermiconidia calcicola]|uniref:Uncharacterized protein n=1 Tax=Vermiconidia calcicola TaxID=1690605 RepID=A0ACC3NR43_9PEZI|nr:hypothetical protein LTR37_003883 [Vermiconidia calcicola]